MGRVTLTVLCLVLPGLVDAGVIDILNNLIKSEIPTVQSQLVSSIPQTYGNCNDGSAPQPCVGTQDLYSVHKKWEYKAYARWITGLKSINISSVVVSDPSGTPRGTPRDKLEVTVSGSFGNLPASIYIGECFTFDKCSVIWDNTHGCCGSNKHFTVNADAVCSKTAGAPPVSSIVPGAVKIDAFRITESIGPIKLNVADITNAVSSAITTAMKTYLVQDAIFPGPNGTKVTLAGWLNSQPVATASIGAACKGM